MSNTVIHEPVLLEASVKEDIDAALGPGAQLALQRQRRGWSIEEVAAQLNLAPRQIHAIESENYAALPGMASVRGFIRGYAKILKIDATPLLAMVAKEGAVLGEPAPLRRAIATPFSETRLPRMGRTGLSSKIFMAACVVALLLIGIIAARQPEWIPALPEILASRLKEATTTTSSVPGVQYPGGPKAVAIDASNAAGIGTSEGASISTPVSVVTEAPVSSGATSLPVSAALPANALVLTLRQDSWIEVVGANRTTLISRLVKAGTTETIEITDPAALTVGNASGVDATWRGVPLDLKSGAKSNVARLNLK